MRNLLIAKTKITTAAALWESGATRKEIADAIRPRGNRLTAQDETDLLLMHLRRRKHSKRGR